MGVIHSSVEIHLRMLEALRIIFWNFCSRFKDFPLTCLRFSRDVPGPRYLKRVKVDGTIFRCPTLRFLSACCCEIFFFSFLSIFPGLVFNSCLCAIEIPRMTLTHFSTSRSCQDGNEEKSPEMKVTNETVFVIDAFVPAHCK